MPTFRSTALTVGSGGSTAVGHSRTPFSTGPTMRSRSLQRQAQLGFLSSAWRVMIEDEPIFDPLQKRKDFQALMAQHQAIETRERAQVLRLRAEGRIPNRSSGS